jgi:hypothetical protein
VPFAGAADIEAEALTRRGDAYRIFGHSKDARDDLTAALAKAEQSGDAELIAASSGALGNLAFLSRRSAVAEPLLTRSRDLARRIGDPRSLRQAPMTLATSTLRPTG